MVKVSSLLSKGLLEKSISNLYKQWRKNDIANYDPKNSIIIIDVSCITLCDGYQNMFRRISCYFNKYIINFQPWK